MPKKGHTEEQIIAALKQYEAGEKVADICRKLSVSQASFYLWKKQYAGLGVQELRELRQLRDENGRLKRLWRISRSTGRSCGRSSQKSCKASTAMPAGEVGTGGIPDRRQARGSTGEGLVEHAAV